jgi:mannose-6-phosphate isomerase-like protein (cupin superfamily)
VLSEETFYVLKGIARMVIDGTAFQLTAGHACLIEPTEEHQIFNIGEGDLAFIAVCVPAWVLDDSVFV